MLDNNIYKKITKNNTRKDFEGVELLSFSIKDMQEYKLKSLDSFIEPEDFFKYLEKIEQNKEYFTYYRGDDMKKYSYGSAESVKELGLGKFFIVGEKGLGFFSEEFCEKRENENVDELINIIKRKFPNFDQSKLPKDNQHTVLKAIIHNSGKENFKEKADSPFVSVAVGNNNLEIASGFASESVKDTFVIMGLGYVSEDIINSEYLVQFMIQDREIIDEEQEILIKNVLWPFSLIGVFVFINGKKEFVVNPWLVEAIKRKDFVQDYYFNVNQEDFEKYYKDLGYKNYIFRRGSVVDSTNDVIYFNE